MSHMFLSLLSMMERCDDEGSGVDSENITNLACWGLFLTSFVSCPVQLDDPPCWGSCDWRRISAVLDYRARFRVAQQTQRLSGRDGFLFGGAVGVSRLAGRLM